MFGYEVGLAPRLVCFQSEIEALSGGKKDDQIQLWERGKRTY